MFKFIYHGRAVVTDEEETRVDEERRCDHPGKSAAKVDRKGVQWIIDLK